MPERLTVESFEPLRGQQFSLVSPDESTISLELAEVKAMPTAPQPWDKDEPSTARTPFSLIFVGPKSPALEQRLYPLANQELGDLGSIFLVPVHENETGRYYEAVFN